MGIHRRLSANDFQFVESLAIHDVAIVISIFQQRTQPLKKEAVMAFLDQEYESGVLREALVELGFTTSDPRRVYERLYRFIVKKDGQKNDQEDEMIFIGTIIGMWLKRPHQLEFSVSDVRVDHILGFMDKSGPRWRIWLKDGKVWLGEFKLL